jgi:hypothetical protein
LAWRRCIQLFTQGAKSIAASLVPIEIFDMPASIHNVIKLDTILQRCIKLCQTENSHLGEMARPVATTQKTRLDGPMPTARQHGLLRLFDVTDKQRNGPLDRRPTTQLKKLLMLLLRSVLAGGQ